MDKYRPKDRYSNFIPITIIALSMATFSSFYTNNNHSQNNQNKQDNKIKNNIEAILVEEEKLYKNQMYTLIPKK